MAPFPPPAQLKLTAVFRSVEPARFHQVCCSPVVEAFNAVRDVIAEPLMVGAVIAPVLATATWTMIMSPVSSVAGRFAEVLRGVTPVAAALSRTPRVAIGSIV